MRRLSGLQREVLALYRQCLREIRKKPLVNTICTALQMDQFANILSRRIQEINFELMHGV
jgi:hypothetical protein